MCRASSSTERSRRRSGLYGPRAGAVLVESVVVIGMLAITLITLLSIKALYEAKIETSRPMRNSAWRSALEGCSAVEVGFEGAKSLLGTLWSQLSHPDIASLLRGVLGSGANPGKVGSAPEVNVHIQAGINATDRSPRVAADPITMPCTVAVTSCCADLDLFTLVENAF